MKSRFHALLITGFLLVSFQLRAQETFDMQRGLTPYGSFKGGDLDSVNMVNGNVSLHIPILSYPQRGKSLRLNYNIYYNDKQFLLNYWMNGVVVNGGWALFSNANGSNSFGHIGAYVNFDQFLIGQSMQTYAVGTCQNNQGSCTNPVTNYFLVGPDDSRHYYGNGALSNGGGVNSSGPVVDHSGYTVGTAGTIDREGNVYANGKITDVDGNYMTPDPTLWTPLGITDTLARVVPEPASTSTSHCSAGATSAQIWNVPGSGGTSVPYYLCYKNLSYQTAFNLNGTYNGFPCYGRAFWTGEASGTQTMLTEVVLPNSTRFQFTYDSYLSLTQLTLPTGGYISYTYQNVILNCGNNSGPKSRVLASRTKYDGTTSTTWHYQWIADTSSGGFWFHVVTDPMGNDEVHHIGPAGNTVDWQTDSYTGCSTINTQYCTPGGTLLKRVKTDYQGDHDYYLLAASQFVITPPAVPMTKTTTVIGVSNGSPTYKVSKTTYTLAPSPYTRTFYTYNGDATLPPGTQSWPFYSGQIATVTDYGYGAGTPGGELRSTTTSYKWQDTSNGGANYLNANLINLPWKVITNTADTGGNQCAETDYAYDESGTLFTYSGATNHGAPPTGSMRGNATTVSRWLSSTPCQSGATGSFVSTHLNVYDTGEDYQDIDARGLTTTHTYDPTFYGAYRTQTQMPDTGSVHHIVTGNYDFYTGLITSFTGQNGTPETTSYSWDFNMRRIQSATFPDTGVTSFTYNDTPGSLQVQMTQSQTASASIIKTVKFDNLGRSVHSILADPEGDDTTDTTYDGAGRVATVSNPHRTAASSTDGTTQTQYDGLGRPVVITKQDGSKVQTSHTDTCAVNTNAVATVVTDEAGKMRQTCSDALGRLIEVDEPGTGALTGTPGTGTVTIGGGPDQSTVINPCQNNVPPAPTSCPYTAWDIGTIFVTVDGYTFQINYGQNDTTSTLVSALASSLNSSLSPVTASVNGAAITITSKATGIAANYSISTSATWYSQYFGYPSFTACVTGVTCTSGSSSGVMAGGTDSSVGSSPLVTLYTYDALGNLLTVNQKGNDPNSANWRTRTFTYDSLSRLLTANNPETGTVTYTYDLDTACTAPNSYPMLLVSKKDARGLRTCLQYDNLNRVTAKTFPNSDPTITYTFDAFLNNTTCGGTGNFGIGRRTGMTDASGSSGWTYDLMGRVWKETHTIGTVTNTIGNCYNLDGSIKQVTYPAGSGSVIAYSYSTAAHLTQVQDTAHSITYLSSTSYAPPGELALATYGSVKETGIYNNRLQPCWYYATTGTQLASNTACTATTGPANVLDLKYSYGWGTNDNSEVLNLTNDKDSNRSVTYTYDMLNRIASASSGGTDCSNVPGTNPPIPKNWGETFTIDAWGNLTNRIVTKCSADPLSVVALSNNRLSGFSYDAAGNMTQNGSANYSYNSESQMIATAGISYLEDGDGARVKKCTEGTDIHGNLVPGTCSTSATGTLYWGAGPMLESDLSGNFQREFIIAGGRRIARRDISGGAAHYYLTDRLGSSSVVASPTGVIENESDYLPYGTERVYSQTLANQNYKFTGKEWDSESGLENFGARFDSSNLGRFMTPDWSAVPVDVPYAQMANPQSLNLYAYVMNSPVTSADLDGHEDDNRSQRITQCNAKAEGEKANARATKPKPASLWAILTGSVAAGMARISPAAARKMWEAANPGQKVPFDTVRGRFQDMAHIVARADGGKDVAENLKPQEHGEHIAEHMANGDFSRWASQAKDTVKSAAQELKSGLEENGKILEEGFKDTAGAVKEGAQEVVEDPVGAIKDATAAVVEAVETGDIPPE